jgi:hypothetical protein
MWRPIDEYVVGPNGRIVTVTDADDWPDEEQFARAERADAIEAARAAAEAEERRQQEEARDMQLLRGAMERRRQAAAVEASRRSYTERAVARRRSERMRRPSVPDLGPDLEALCASEGEHDWHVFAPPYEWKRQVAYWLITTTVPRSFGDIHDYVTSVHNGDRNLHSALGAFVRDLRSAGVIRQVKGGFESASEPPASTTTLF